MEEPAAARFERELAEVSNELAGWLVEHTPEQAVQGFAERFGGPDSSRGILARGALASFVDGEQRERANRAAHLLELLAAEVGDSAVVLWDRYEEGLERERDEAVTGLSSAAQGTEAKAAWAATVTRREARAVQRQMRAIRADLAAAGTRALLLLAGGWLLGIRFATGLGWMRGVLVVLAVAVASSALHRALLPRQARVPETFRARFALVQPWLMTVALQSALLYWLGGSVRLSFWATVLGLGFSVMSWPSGRVLDAWRGLGLSDEDRVRP